MDFTGQLFIRKAPETEEGVYMVCGLIKIDKPLDDESVYLFCSNKARYGLIEEVGDKVRGKGFDSIMYESKMWRKFK